jgi:small conductance mechanosensitive channel
VAILVLTVILWMFVKILCGRSRAWIAHAGRGTPAERQNRADTLAGVFHNTGNVVIAIGSLLMILDAAGVPVAALLGGAGVVGLAVAFGAQSLIKDYFCGFILLLENQYTVNDVVTIGGLTGSVERITLRITVLRDFEGKVYFIPNGQVSSVTNATMDWSRAVLEIGVAYKENVDQVMEALTQITGQLREEPEYSDSILSDVEMLGVDNLSDSSVVIKFGLKTRPDRKWPVKRELLRRIKNTFDERGIEIPFPHQTVIHRTENERHARPVEDGTLSALGDGRGGSANSSTSFVPPGVPHTPNGDPQLNP